MTPSQGPKRIQPLEAGPIPLICDLIHHMGLWRGEINETENSGLTGCLGQGLQAA